MSKLLQDAIAKRERDYVRALDALRRDDEPDGVVHDLREAIELARCCRRLLAGRSVEEIHRAFGAPGDFGYDTPIGDALSKIYRGEA